MPRKKPIKLLTLDTETYNGLLGDLKRIAIYDGDNVIYDYSFLSIEKEIIKLSKKYDVHIYIHNMEFDIRKMKGLFNDNRIIWDKSFIINNKLATVKTKHYTLHDSFKILPMSLSKLSSDFEVSHGKLDLWEEVEKTYPQQYTDVVDFLNRCDVDDPLYLKYLGYDVISLYEILQKIMDISGLTLDIFVKRISTASLSRYIFKNGFKGEEFKNPLNRTTDYEILSQYNWHDNLDLEFFHRQSYCGGRTEVFKPLLNNQGFHYDINSMYPFVMLNEFPVGKPDYYNTPNIAKEMFYNWLENHNGLGFIHAHVFIPKQHIPPLPVKMGKLVFPCGEVFGVWTYNELEYAIKNCGVELIEVFAVSHFSNTFPVFNRFITTFYELKEQATKDKNESLRSFAKLIMNVGYGYTGMSRDDKMKLDNIENIEKYNANEIFINDEFGYIEVPTDIKAEYIQVQIASYVTSYARIVLLEALRQADQRGNVYYCDTDSIVTDVELPADLIDDSKLGYWDCEAKPIKALFLRPKVYAEVIDEKKTNVKFKGVSRDTQKQLTFESYENLYQEMIDNVNDFVVVEKNKTMLRSVMYMTKNNIDMDYYETRDKKININTVEKRVMNYEDNYTEPLYFDTLEDFQTFEFKRVREEVGY